MGQNSVEKDYNLNGWEYGLAGAVTGVFTRFLCQPLDVLKIRFQLQVTPLKSKRPVKYTTMRQTIWLMIQEEGLSSLWKGHVPAQFLSVVFGAVQFSSYELLFDIGRRSFPNCQPWGIAVLNSGCGTAAGVAATVVSFPFDVIRTHLVFQGEPKVYKGVVDAALKIHRKEGLRGFSKGMSAAIIQTAPMSGLTFSFKGIFRDIWLWLFSQIDTSEPVSLSPGGVAITSLFAGICAKTVVYPLDLMKKRLQIQGFDESKSCSKKVIECTTIKQCLVLTVQREGYLGLFKGIVPSVMKAGASTAIYFTMYDQVCQFMAYSKKS